MQGVQQDQTAGEGLLQYLHAAIVVLPGSNATTLNASILAGVTRAADSTDGDLPGTAHATPATPSSTPPSTTSLSARRWLHESSIIHDYDAVNSSAVFTYYYNNYSVTPVVPRLDDDADERPAERDRRRGVDVTFLAGPHEPTAGFQAVRPSNFQTTIYLQNAAGAPAPTTTMTLARHPSGTSRQLPLTVTATVQPGSRRRHRDLHRDSRRTTLSGLHLGGRSEHDGRTATLHLHPAAGGTYDVTAAFSGTSDFQPSTSAVTLIVVPIDDHRRSVSGHSPAATARSPHRDR